MAGQEFDKSFNKFYFLPCFEQFVEEHPGSSFSVWREELHSSPASSRFASSATRHSRPVPARNAALNLACSARESVMMSRLVFTDRQCCKVSFGDDRPNARIQTVGRWKRDLAIC